MLKLWQDRFVLEYQRGWSGQRQLTNNPANENVA